MRRAQFIVGALTVAWLAIGCTPAYVVPSSGPLVALPGGATSLTFDAANQTASVTVSESGYTGTFSAQSNGAAVATVGPASGTTFTVTAVGAGNASITFTDAAGRSAHLSVTVTISSGVIGLSGRPGHVTAGEHMHVQMVDGLSAIRAGVKHEPVAVAAALAPELRRDANELREQRRFSSV